MSKGIKYSEGKPMVGTLISIFPDALLAIGDCIREGAKKYPEVDNWKRVENAISEYTESAMRHLLKYQKGIIFDEDDELPHIAHFAWNALAITQLILEDMQSKGYYNDNNKPLREI